MAIDSNIALQVANPETLALNALAISGQQQQQRQAAAMAPLQQQAAQLEVQSNTLKVQQQQYQMQQMQAMARAANTATQNRYAQRTQSSPEASTAPSSSGNPTPSDQTPQPTSDTSDSNSIPSALLGGPSSPAGPPMPTGSQGPSVPANLMGTGIGPLSGADGTGLPASPKATSAQPPAATIPGVLLGDQSSPTGPSIPPGDQGPQVPANAAGSAGSPSGSDQNAILPPPPDVSAAKVATSVPGTSTTSVAPQPQNSPMMPGTPTTPANSNFPVPSADENKWWADYIENMRKNGVHPQTIMNVIKERNQMMEGLANLSKEQQEVVGGQLKAYGAVAETMAGITDPQQRLAYWQNQGRPLLTQSGFSDAQLPPATQLPNDQELQQHLATYYAFSGAYNDVKGQVNTLAQIMGSASSKADHDSKLNAAIASKKFASGIISQFNHPWTGPETASADRVLGQSPEEQEKGPQQAAQSAQAMRANDAASLTMAIKKSDNPVISRANYITARAALGDRGKDFADPPPEGQYDPASFASKVNQSGLTPEQVAVNTLTQAQRDQTAKYQAARIALQQQLLDQRKEFESRGASAAIISGLNAQADKYDQLKNLAITNNQLADQLDGIANTKPDKAAKVFLPGTTTPQVVTPELITAVKQRSQLLRTEATNSSAAADAIAARNHFAAAPKTPATPAATTPTTPAPAAPTTAPKATPAKQAAPPPPPPKAVTDKLPPGIHTFGNGQTWQKNADGTVSFVK